MIATRQEPEVRAWWQRKAQDEDGPAMPGMSQRFLELEAAVLFGMGLDDFLRRPAHRRVEMMAHVVIRKQREIYCDHVLHEHFEQKRKKEKAGSGNNPVERMYRGWMLK